MDAAADTAYELAQNFEDQLNALRNEFTGYEFDLPYRHREVDCYSVLVKCPCRNFVFVATDRDILERFVHVMFREQVMLEHIRGCVHGRRDQDASKKTDECKTNGCVMIASNGWRCFSCMNKAAMPIAKAEVQPPSRTQLGPLDQLIDGITLQECVNRFQTAQRTDNVHDWLMLTDAQQEAAGEAWSAALRVRVQESKDKERQAVVLDEVEW